MCKPVISSDVNKLTSVGAAPPCLPKDRGFLQLKWSVILLTIALTAGWTKNAQAESPATAPPQLKATLAQIDAAANRRDVNSVMQFYAGNFKHSDGLTRQTMMQALTDLWKRYPQLTYRTELKDWKTEGNSIVAETVTNIAGIQISDGKTMKLESVMRSRQRLENQKIVQQDILGERTQISSGSKPPAIQINLPEQVGVGQAYNFDVIVTEPLGDDLLLGTALEESIKPERLLKPTDLKLELLPAGGVFKLGKAPNTKDNRWLSAVLIRGNGMVMVTQRLVVVDRPVNSAGQLQ
ncbi:MAG: nuclear transport factor 2 family protein [Coleofasciculaceae cyanobacterium]